MAKFTAENQPDRSKGRGKSFKTKLMDAIRESALLELRANASAEEAEQAFLSHMASRAFNPEDSASPTLLKSMLDKSYTATKATMPMVQMEFDTESSPAQKVDQIIKAASDGVIAPDVAQIFIGAIKAAIDIEAATDLKERIEQLEKMLTEKSA